MMRHRIPSNLINAPRTTREFSEHELSTYDKEFRRGEAIVCSKCGLGGGTLEKDGEGYHHPYNDSRCKLLQHRKKVIND